jgi:hypothetical protein
MHSQFAALREIDPIAARAYSEVLEAPHNFPAWGGNTQPIRGYLSLVGISAVYLVTPFSEREEPLFSSGTFIPPDHVEEREVFLDRYRAEVGPYQGVLDETAEVGSVQMVTDTCLTLAAQRRRLLGGFAVYADEPEPPQYFSQLFVANTMVQAVQFVLRESALQYGQLRAERQAAIDAAYPQARPAGQSREDAIRLNPSWRSKALLVLAELMQTPDDLSAALNAA